MPSRPRTRPVKEVPSKPTRTGGRPSGKSPDKRKVEQLTAQRALWSDEQVETAVGWLATIDESQAGDIAMRLQELASNPTLARLHGPTILASVARLGAPITGLVERLPLELSCGERAMFLSAGGSDWQSRGRIVAAVGERRTVERPAVDQPWRATRLSEPWRCFGRHLRDVLMFLCYTPALLR